MVYHKTKLARKPEEGTEHKAIANGDSGILLGLELVEGAARRREKARTAQFGEGTAIVLCLAHQYRGSERTIVTDNAFVSMKTLVQLENQLGLSFMCIVKTASVGYPKTHLNQWFDSSSLRGTFKVLQFTTADGMNMYAMHWTDRKPTYIILNQGTTLLGLDSVRVRHRLRLFSL